MVDDSWLLLVCYCCLLVDARGLFCVACGLMRVACCVICVLLVSCLCALFVALFFCGVLFDGLLLAMFVDCCSLCIACCSLYVVC